MSRWVLTVWLAGLGIGCQSPAEHPTILIEARPFVHRVSAEGNLRATQTTKISVPSSVRRRVRLAWIADEGTLLEEGELVALFDRKELEQSLGVARSSFRGADLEADETRAQGDIRLGELERDAGVAELDLDFASEFQKTDDFVFSRREIMESAIDGELALARREHAQEMGGIHRELTQTELDLIGIRKRKAQLEMEDAQVGLDGLEVRSPHRGILRLARNWRGDAPKVGSEMWRGQEIGEIPALDELEAEVFVLEADAGGLEVGKSASVRLESRPGEIYPAEIVRIEALAKPRFRGSPVQYFGVTLKLDLTDPKVMKPGQRVHATLALAELESAISIPRQAVFREGELAWVYVQQGLEFEMREVMLGIATPGLLVIEKGLEEAERVALWKPDGLAIEGAE